MSKRSRKASEVHRGVHIVAMQRTTGDIATNLQSHMQGFLFIYFLKIHFL